MYTLLLLGAIGLVIGIIIASRIDGGEKFWGAVIGTVIGGVVGLFAAGIAGSFVPRVDVVYGPANLVAMRSSDGVSGTFIWGSGTIRQGTSYNFMMKLSDGSMTPGSVPANSLVRIIEDESLKGTGTWTTTIREADTKSPFYKWTLFTSDGNETVRQEFRVPVGTVVQTFKVE